jgi:tetratricopeptide (TPR) repeat protein
MSRRRSMPNLARAIALAVLALAGAALAVEAKAPSEGQRLAEAALAEYRRAETLETGWQEVYDRGLALAEQAVALDPHVADGYYAIFLNLGRKSERTGMAAQAKNVGRLKDALAKTLEADPNHAHAWEARGEMLMRLPWILGGSEKDGERALRRSAELAPEWPKPMLRLAQYDGKEGRVAQARSEAQRALELARKRGDETIAKDAEALLTELDRKER